MKLFYIPLFLFNSNNLYVCQTEIEISKISILPVYVTLSGTV